MHFRKNGKFAWTVAGALMVAALLWPALWNGFPIVFYDTGGYLARPFESTLGMGRSAFYGVFLWLGIKSSFWPNIIVQAALIAWLVVLMLRLNGLGGRPWLATAIVIGLCAMTGVSWYAAQLMPDILVPALVLAFAMLGLYADGLRRWEAAILIVVIAAAIASHNSILALAVGILVLLVLQHLLLAWSSLSRPSLVVPALACAGGILLAALSNFVVTKQFALTPGGYNFVFGRLVQSGIVAHYLAERCPDPTIKLCAYRSNLPATGDDWLWDANSPIQKLGGFEKFEPEARRIVIESMALYPAMNLKAAVTATITQFSQFATGDGTTPWNWYTQWIFEQYSPGALKQYLASRQARAPFDFSWANLIHIPAQALAIALLPIIIWFRRDRRIASLAAYLFFALLINAVICGALSNPHDRYQSRLAWLAPLVVASAALGRRRHPAIAFSVRVTKSKRQATAVAYRARHS